MAIDFDFKSWILAHQGKEYMIIQDNSNHMILKTDYGEANIRFTDIEDSTIVEFEIKAYKDNTSKFYLHFELNDREHAKHLYGEMVESLLKLKEEKTLRILLSCSSGMTTSFFADLLNSTAEMLDLDYHFDAVMFTRIYEAADEYDVILIAPQIGYMYKRINESMPNKLVLQVPTAVFAKYDALATIELIQESLDKYNKSKYEAGEYTYETIKIDKRILAIAIITAPSITRIYYQVEDHGEVIDSNLIIKPAMYIFDLYDIIDTVLLRHGYLDIIGIATPGIVKDSKELKDIYSDKIFDIHKEFEEKYNIDVCIYNNCNAAAVGFSLAHPEYKNIIYHSQPFGIGTGGQGIVLNGKIVVGKNGIAGEIMRVIYRMQLSDDPNKLIRTQNGAVELVSKELLPTIITVGPDVVALYCSMTPDMDEIKNALLSFVDEENLPEFYYVNESHPYILSGITSMCIDYMNNRQ